MSAIEEDLRAVAITYLPDMDPEFALDGAYQVASDRLLRQVGALQGGPKLADLLPYLDFAESWQLLTRHDSELPTPLADHVKHVTSKLSALVPVRNRVAHSRPLDYEDFSLTFDLAKELAGSRDFPWLNLREVSERLSNDPGYVLGLDVQFPSLAEEPGRHNLPTPEYDETGFVGRKEIVANLRRLLVKGPYPVVSVVGDGGIGKTSLALKVAYEVIDADPCPFDAVVWVTAKTSLLTASEVTRIEGAISDSLGLLAAVAHEVGGESALADPINEVLGYLEHFKILLILDNLETVLDQRLRDFLANLPSGSKVLITSRIGVGAYEHPVRLGPLERTEGLSLFRALTRMRQVASLQRLGNDVIAGLVDKMGGRPLYLRWFVSAVEAGARPEEVLANSDLLLDFCMSNVYDYLHDDSHAVLRSMQALPGLHSQAELAFLNDMQPELLQPALLQLANTYFVSLQTSGGGGSLETQYDLTDFGRKYLDRQHPVSGDERTWLIRRHEQLTSSGRRLQSQYQANPFSSTTLDTRGVSDFSVASTLHNAISLIVREHLPEAYELITRSKELAPGYHEVHRVEGDWHAASFDYINAREAYERAVELGPTAIPLRYLFAKFLCGHGGDPEEGLRQLQAGALMSPDEPRLALEIGRTHLQLGHLDEAKDIGLALYENEGLSHDLRHEAARLALEGSVGQAQRAADEDDWASCVAALQELLRALTEITSGLVNNRSRALLDQARVLAHLAQRNTSDAYVGRIAVDVMAALAGATVDSLADFEARSYGRVVRLVAERGFGFIRETGTGEEFFFHMSHLRKRADWQSCAVGSSVSFVPGQYDKGLRAEKIILLRN
ncbi:NB-ARC domain-containing protein [Actinoplanes solisilvae]|uniref:NB-ARC domain-containing protein n=1 Tax=Actinoplanes solisilvae TaxID=2486853 RepID=UPI0013E2E8B4|nr:NB-ARC domain-containing protein [Actinoplanes solisilvae]